MLVSSEHSKGPASLQCTGERNFRMSSFPMATQQGPNLGLLHPPSRGTQASLMTNWTETQAAWQDGPQSPATPATWAVVFREHSFN